MYQYILVHTSIYGYDTIVVIQPYPYSITEDIDNVPFKDCWYARPQLFFQCQTASVLFGLRLYLYVPVCTSHGMYQYVP